MATNDSETLLKAFQLRGAMKSKPGVVDTVVFIGSPGDSWLSDRGELERADSQQVEPTYWRDGKASFMTLGFKTPLTKDQRKAVETRFEGRQPVADITVGER
jgi:hypothetical protein